MMSCMPSQRVLMHLFIEPAAKPLTATFSRKRECFDGA